MIKTTTAIQIPMKTARERNQAVEYYAMLSSLNLAIIESGGCEVDTNKLQHMTAYELMETLALNGVRFVLNNRTKNKLRTN